MLHSPKTISPTFTSTDGRSPSSLNDILIGSGSGGFRSHLDKERDTTKAFYELANLTLLLAELNDEPDDMLIMTLYLLHLIHPGPGKHLASAIQVALVGDSNVYS